MSQELSEALLQRARQHGGDKLLEDAADALRAVEGAAVVDVISGGMMVRPFKQYGRLSLPDDGDNPATREARFLGQFVGQRVALVPLDAAGSAEGVG